MKVEKLTPTLLNELIDRKNIIMQGIHALLAD